MGAGGGRGWVMGIEENTCGDEHCVLYGNQFDNEFHILKKGGPGLRNPKMTQYRGQNSVKRRHQEGDLWQLVGCLETMMYTEGDVAWARTALCLEITVVAERPLPPHMCDSVCYQFHQAHCPCSTGFAFCLELLKQYFPWGLCTGHSLCQVKASHIILSVLYVSYVTMSPVCRICLYNH